MNNSKIMYERVDDVDYSTMSGSYQDVLHGIAHIIATFAYDAVSDHNDLANSDTILAATMQYLALCATTLLDQLNKENACINS